MRAIVALLGILVAGACEAASIQVSSVTPIAGNFSLRTDASGGGVAYLQQNGLSLSNFVLSFKADFDDLASQASVGVPILTLFDTTVEQRRRFQLVFLQNSVLFSNGLESNVAVVYPEALAAGVHEYRLAINIATGAIELRVDNVVIFDVINDFSPTTVINQLRFGITESSATAGATRLDDFSIDIPGQPMPAFFDDFETGDISRWSAAVP